MSDRAPPPLRRLVWWCLVLLWAREVAFRLGDAAGPGPGPGPGGTSGSAGRHLPPGTAAPEAPGEPFAKVRGLGPDRTLELEAVEPCLVRWRDEPDRSWWLPAGTWRLPEPEAGDPWILERLDGPVPQVLAIDRPSWLDATVRQLLAGPRPWGELEHPEALHPELRPTLATGGPDLLAWLPDLMTSNPADKVRPRSLWNLFQAWETLAVQGGRNRKGSWPPGSTSVRSVRQEARPRRVEAADCTILREIPRLILADLRDEPTRLPGFPSPPIYLEWCLDTSGSQGLVELVVGLDGLDPNCWIRIEELREGGDAYEFDFSPRSEVPAGSRTWLSVSLPADFTPRLGSFLELRTWGPDESSPRPQMAAAWLSSPTP